MRKLLLIASLINLQITAALAQTTVNYADSAIKAIKTEHYQSALQNIDQAIKQDTANAYYYDLRGQALTGMKQFQKAYAYFKIATELAPKNSMLYNDFGLFWVKVGNYDTAVTNFTKALNRVTNNKDKLMILVNQAAAYQYERNFKGAYKDLIKAYQIDSNDLAVLIDLGAACDPAGHGQETLKYLLKAVEIDSSFGAAYGNIGFKYQQMGQYRKAIKYFNKAIKLKPDGALGYSNRSYNEYKLGQLDSAFTDIQKSLRLYPTNSYAYKVRALIYIRKGEKEKACADLQKALDLGYTTSYGDDVMELQKKNCSGESR